MTSVDDLVSRVQSINDTTSFDLSKECGQLLASSESEDNSRGRKILINVLDSWSNVPTEHQPIWIDLMEAAGFYPYIHRSPENIKLMTSTAQHMRKQYHLSKNLKDVYFHDEQKNLSNLLSQKKNIIISAPTSFGKSLLIEDIVASKKYKNIVVIQPTLALLDETRRKLKKYSEDYKVIVKTSQEQSIQKGNLFLLTAERVMEYPELPKIDFFIIDEFYKLSAKRDDERSDILNNAFHLLLSFDAQFYLLGPNIDGISSGFAEKYNAEFIKTDYSLVDNQEVNIYSKHSDKFAHPIINKGYKEDVLFKLLVELSDQQTIIYCSSPERARRLAAEFTLYLKSQVNNTSRSITLVDWIKENVHQAWGMIDCLENGVGVHDGALPKHMTSSVIKYFNDEKINFLFCTSTIIEGVNTSAKNVIFFDPKKGGRNIDYFDYANIRGRSGRLMVHYIGKVYNFNKPPEKQNIVIDIPFFDQKNITPEVLIHLKNNEIKDKTTEEYKKIEAMSDIERNMIQKNGLSVKGQQSVIEKLKQDIKTDPELILWNGMPTYKQLQYAINLGWDNFIKPGETTRPFTKGQILVLTFNYGKDQDINFLIRSQFLYYKTLQSYETTPDNEVLDDAVRFAFQALRHWFSYKIPKWLLTIDRLQKYVAQSEGLKAGDYSFYASQIENDFIRPNLTILDEYGVPRSAIKKLERYIGSDLTEDQVLRKVSDTLSAGTGKFSEYEIEKLKESL